MTSEIEKSKNILDQIVEAQDLVQNCPLADNLRNKAVRILTGERYSKVSSRMPRRDLVRVMHPAGLTNKIWATPPVTMNHNETYVRAVLFAEKKSLTRSHIAKQLIYLAINEDFASPFATIHPSLSVNSSSFIVTKALPGDSEPFRLDDPEVLAGLGSLLGIIADASKKPDNFVHLA